MGSILSAIDDDIQEYENLCDKYGVNPVGVYSLHAAMLHEMHHDCQQNIPPAKHSARVEKFKKDYEQALQNQQDKNKQRRLRFKALHKTLSREDLSILQEGYKNSWPVS